MSTNGITNAVARLTRAGGENSRATEKLHEAAKTVALLIEQEAPVNVTLPRGYRVVRRRSNIGSEKYLVVGDLDKPYDDGLTYIDGTGGYLHGDFSCPIPNQTRAGSLQFAADVADGLLDEISAFLEAWAVEADRAAGILAEKADEVRS